MSYRWTTSQCQSRCDNRVRTTDYSIAIGSGGRRVDVDASYGKLSVPIICSGFG
jgi:hypothetical protein